MLAHDEAGTGPPLVLVHAGVADRTMWGEHLEPLSQAGFRVVAPDLPGFGEQTVMPGEQAPWTDVLTTMDELAIDQTALVGNSFGAAVALRVAVVAPERVSALGLFSCPAPGLEPSAELQAAWDAEEEALDRDDIEGAVRAVVEAWTLPDAPGGIRERVAAMQRRALTLQAQATGVREAPDPVEERPHVLAELDIPALVAVGGRDKPDFLEAADRLARTLPRARHEVIEDAGHLPPLETPAEFRELLLDFLA